MIWWNNMSMRALTKEEKLEALFHLKNQCKTYLILKSVPWQLVKMETRLNRRLNTIMNKMIKNLLKDPLYTAREIEAPIQSAYASMIPATSHAALLDVAKIPHIDISSAIQGPSRWGTLMEDRTFKASDRTINRMTGDVLEKMKEHVTDGKSQQKTVRELSGELKDMKKYELERITRTETHSIYMEARHDLYVDIPDVVGKQWKTTGLDNVRPWHQDMDGEIVPLEEPFSNGLMYPGDVDGDAEEVINCYCSMDPVKAEGMP